MDTHIPISFSSLVSCSFADWIIQYVSLGFSPPMCNTLHLSALNFSCHLLVHFCHAVKSFWRIVESASIFMVLNSFVSPMNILIRLLTTSGMSLMKIINKRGPRTLPCGMLLMTCVSREDTPAIETFCLLPMRNDLTHVIIFPLMPYPYTFLTSL